MDHGRPDRPDELLALAVARDDDAFTSAGFRISVISEPQPVPATRELFPAESPMLRTNSSFLFFPVCR